jgi:hypothetical protein
LGRLRCLSGLSGKSLRIGHQISMHRGWNGDSELDRRFVGDRSNFETYHDGFFNSDRVLI